MQAGPILPNLFHPHRPRQVAAAIQLQQTASRKAVHVARAQPEDLVDAGAGFEEPESAAGEQGLLRVFGCCFEGSGRVQNSRQGNQG